MTAQEQQERADSIDFYRRHPNEAVDKITELYGENYSLTVKLKEAVDKIARLEAQLSDEKEMLRDATDTILQYEKTDKGEYENSIMSLLVQNHKLKAQLSADREAINHIYKTEKQ